MHPSLVLTSTKGNLLLKYLHTLQKCLLGEKTNFIHSHSIDFVKILEFRNVLHFLKRVTIKPVTKLLPQNVEVAHVHN